MSCCRWSSDDFRSDVYVYANGVGGWTTHVASNRVVCAAPLPEPVALTKENVDAWYERQEIVMEIIGRSSCVSIKLPYAGESFCDATPGDCADRLEALRMLGYRVPNGVIEDLREEDGGPR